MSELEACGKKETRLVASDFRIGMQFDINNK